MKRIFIVVILSLLFASCKTNLDSVSCIGTDRKVHKLHSSPYSIYVGFSSLGCHDCHEILNSYLEEHGLYDNDTIELYGLIALKKDKIRNKLSQQMAIASMKQYYPSMKQFRFCEQIDDNIKILGRRVKYFNTPFVLRVYNNQYSFLDSDLIFVQNGKRMTVSNFFEERLFEAVSPID